MAYHLRGAGAEDRFLLEALNVSKTTVDTPEGDVYVALLLLPFFVVGAAIALCICRTIATAKIFAGNEAPKIVLTSDYRLHPGRKAGVGEVKTMYDWAKGVGAKAEKGFNDAEEVRVKQSKEERIQAKRQRAIIDQVFGVIRENMTNLRTTASAIFTEFDADQSGVLSYWEFTKGMERLGVKLSDSRIEMIMRDLDEDGNGEVGLLEFENALALNKFRAAPPTSPDAWTPMDPIWNKIYHGLGAPDATALSRIFDPENTGAASRDNFVEILMTRNIAIKARELDLVGEVIDNLDMGIMDMAIFSSNLSASARRLLASLLTKLHALVEARGGITFFAAYSQGDSRLVSYSTMQMMCDDLESGMNSEELTLIFTNLDTQESGYIPLDVLTYSMVAAWHTAMVRIWLEVRKSALGQLSGDQAARVLTMGNTWVAYPDFTAGLGDNGINLEEDDILLLLVQLGSSIEGVVHALDFATKMDDQISLATYAAYARIHGALSIESISLKDSLEALDGRSVGYITHAQFVELLRTFDIALPNEDLAMLLSRLDSKNDGKINITEFTEDMLAYTRSESVWETISDALGPSGGAQLEAFLGEGSAMTTNAVLAALRQMGIDLSDQEFDWVLNNIDPRKKKYIKVETFVLLVHAHRERVMDVVWIKVLREFASTHDAIKKIASVSSSDTTFTYDELISSFEGIAFSEAETRTLLLALDPNDTGLIRAYAVEHEMTRAKANRLRAADYKKVSGSGRLNVMQILEDAKKQLLLTNSKAFQSEEDKLRMRELTQHVKVLEITIKSLNKWQKELAGLSGKRKPTDLEKERLQEVEHHIRVNQESIRQMQKVQRDIDNLVDKGTLTEGEQLTLESLRKQTRDLTDNVNRTLKIQNDLSALNAKAIAKAGLTEAEQARRLALRKNHEPLAAEIRLADKRREESEDHAVKRAANEEAAKQARIEKLWTDLADYMRRRNVTAKRMYRQFDEGGTGALSYWAFYKGIQSIGVSFDEDDTDLLMSDIDVNETGSVPYDAFRAKLRDQDPHYQQKKALRETRKKEKAEKAAQASSWFGLGMFGESSTNDGESDEGESDDDDDDDDDELHGGENNTAGGNILEAGTPIMAMHTKETGYFRATVSKDNLDGTCDIQFALASLGRDSSKSKTAIRSLAQEEEIRALWLEVSRTVGRRGSTELRRHADFAGMLSHDALVAWLETREMDPLSDHAKHVVLAEVDPLHSGTVSVTRFLEKLEHFRARAKILGLNIFHRHDREILPDEAADASKESEKSDVKSSGIAGATASGVTIAAANAKDGAVKSGQVSVQSQARMMELEALIFAMAKRQQELALALSASEARTASLNSAVQSIKEEPVFGGDPLLRKNQAGEKSDGLYIMPDIKTGEVTWLNKNTGMRFVREGSDAKSKKKRKSSKKKSVTSTTGA